MSAFVSTQFEGGYPRPLVSIRTLDQRGDSGIVCRKGPRDVMQHPSSTQIQAIQVSQSPIGSIRGLYGEQGLGSSQFGQYTIQPAGKERWFHQTSHQGRCTERCREKILSAGLKMQRVVTIVSEKGNRPLGDQGSGPGSPHRTRPVIDQTEREGGLIVGAGAHRSTKFFEPTGQIGRRHRDQWLQACLPSCGRLRTHERKFVGECQHPSQAVGSLEGGVRVQVLCFALEGLFIELLFEQLMTTGSGVPVAQKATSSNEKPVRVHGGVPVETAEEDGMHLCGRFEPTRFLNHDGQVVGIGPGNARQGKVRASCAELVSRCNRKATHANPFTTGRQDPAYSTRSGIALSRRGGHGTQASADPLLLRSALDMFRRRQAVLHMSGDALGI